MIWFLLYFLVVIVMLYFTSLRAFKIVNDYDRHEALFFAIVLSVLWPLGIPISLAKVVADRDRT